MTRRLHPIAADSHRGAYDEMQFAASLSTALEYLRSAANQCDSHPRRTLGDGMPSASSDDTAVESAVELRYTLTTEIEDIRDVVDGINQLRQSLYVMANRVLDAYESPPAKPKTCDGSALTGAGLSWTPHSRNTDNGWRNPLCGEIASVGPLCPTCYARARRWRAAHGLPALDVGQAEGVGSVSASAREVA